MRNNFQIRSDKHVMQQDVSDCGVACIQSVLRYFGSDASLEVLRNLSGTTPQGTSMMGLLQASQQTGLIAEGFLATIDQLKECEDVCILHVVLNQYMQHFIVFYGYDQEKDCFWIGDPAEKEIKAINSDHLNHLWQTKTLLLIKPGPALIKAETIRKKKLQWIISLIDEDKNILVFAVLFGFIIAALGLSTAIFSQKLIDVIIPSNNSSKLFIGLFVLFTFLSVRQIFNYVRTIMLIKQGKDFNIRTLDSFFFSLLNLTKSFFDSRKTGDLIARMNDTQRIQQTISALISQASIDIILGLVALIALMVFNWKIGLINLIWFPLFFWAFRSYRPLIIAGQRNRMKQYSFTESQFIDNIQGIGEIKRKNKQINFFQITKRTYQSYHQTGHDLAITNVRYKLVIELLNNCCLVFIFGWSAFFVMKDEMTLGSMMAVLQFLGMITNAAFNLAQLTIGIEEAYIAFDRMYEFASLEKEYEPETEANKVEVHGFQELNVKNLSFRFPGRPHLLEDVSFYVKKGECIAILGESGCGKSTILQILQKFYKIESGSIFVNQHHLDQVKFESWRSKIGIVPQEIKLFNGTVLDNIFLGDPLEDVEQIQSDFSNFGFDQFFLNFPNGYSTILGEAGVNISGGQKQILGLARALVHKPELLLLDEPSSALDRNTEKFVLDLLERLKDTIGIIILTHQPKIAKRSDRIYIIEHGTIGRYGNHHHLLQSENLYANSWADLLEKH